MPGSSIRTSRCHSTLCPSDHEVPSLYALLTSFLRFLLDCSAADLQPEPAAATVSKHCEGAGVVWEDSGAGTCGEPEPSLPARHRGHEAVQRRCCAEGPREGGCVCGRAGWQACLPSHLPPSGLSGPGAPFSSCCTSLMCRRGDIYWRYCALPQTCEILSPASDVHGGEWPQFVHCWKVMCQFRVCSGTRMRALSTAHAMARISTTGAA